MVMNNHMMILRATDCTFSMDYMVCDYIPIQLHDKSYHLLDMLTFYIKLEGASQTSCSCKRKGGCEMKIKLEE